MKDNPFFSIIIPAKNAAEFISEVLESVLAQTFQSYEVFVIDDNSNDSTLDILQSYQKKFKAEQLKILFSPADHLPGPSAVRNVGIFSAKGEVIAFLDADDLWTSDHLENACKSLVNYPEAVVYYAKARCFDSDTRKWGPTFGEGADKENIPFEALQLMLWKDPVPQSAGCVRRYVAKNIGGYDEHLRTIEDSWFWICCAKQGPFVFNPQVEMFYRVHDGSDTGGGWNVTTMLYGPPFVNVVKHSQILTPDESAPFCVMIKDRTSRQLQTYLRAGRWNIIRIVWNNMITCSPYERRIWIVVWAMAVKDLFRRAVRSLAVKTGLLPFERQFK